MDKTWGAIAHVMHMRCHVGGRDSLTQGRADLCAGAHCGGVRLPTRLLGRWAVRAVGRWRGQVLVLGLENHQGVSDPQLPRQRVHRLRLASLGGFQGGHVWLGWLDQVLGLEGPRGDWRGPRGTRGAPCATTCWWKPHAGRYMAFSMTQRSNLAI